MRPSEFTRTQLPTPKAFNNQVSNQIEVPTRYPLSFPLGSQLSQLLEMFVESEELKSVLRVVEEFIVESF